MNVILSQYRGIRPDAILLLLVAVFLPLQACGVPDGALAPQVVTPVIAAGQLEALGQNTTINLLNSELRREAPYILRFGDTFKYVVQGAIPNWTKLRFVIMVDATMPDGYSLVTNGVLGNAKDVEQLMIDLQRRGWETSSPKDLTNVTMMSRVAYWAARITVSSEVVFGGVSMFWQDWLEFVQSGEDL